MNENEEQIEIINDLINQIVSRGNKQSSVQYYLLDEAIDKLTDYLLYPNENL